MGLADTFQQIVDSLPDDWTDLELDLRIEDESRYRDAAVYMVTCNAQPYSHHDWHFRILVAHRFGHAAAVTHSQSANERIRRPEGPQFDSPAHRTGSRGTTAPSKVHRTDTPYHTSPKRKF